MNIPNITNPISTPAELLWHNNQPFSQRFQDIYFSADGLAETQHVFLHHNGLARRWAALPAHTHFTIIENGFGSGLNFLCAWALFQESAPSDAFLHFVSTERYPLRPQDLAHALAAWPSLTMYRQALLDQYTLPAPGFQRLHFGAGRITLTLLIGDVNQTLPELDAAADCWFLDGFAPAKNPDMWSDELFRQMARLSRPGATFSTFTSAGMVKRALQAVGFHVEKVAGHGSKREMLRGHYMPTPTANWLALQHPPRRVCIIGAGLAGCHTAQALAQRGWSVTLLEQHPQPAQAASGNPLGVLYARLSVNPNSRQLRPLSELILQGLEYSYRLLQQSAPELSSLCGVLQLAFDSPALARATALSTLGLPENILRLVSAAEASQIAGLALQHPAIFFAQAGWASPPQWCGQLVRHALIEVLTKHHASALTPHTQGWQIHTQHGSIKCDYLILANAHEANTLLGTRGLPTLPMKYLRGQITQFPANASSHNMRSVVCGAGYCSPSVDGWHTCGATFDKTSHDLNPTLADHQSNLNALAALSSELASTTQSISLTTLRGRVGLRCTTPDFKPIVGWLTLPNEQPLGLNLAHGARGLITTALAAQALVDHLHDSPRILPRQMQAEIHPQRFISIPWHN